MTLCHVGGRHDYATARNRRPEGRCSCDRRDTTRKLIGRVQVLTLMTAKVYTVISCEARLSCASASRCEYHLIEPNSRGYSIYTFNPVYIPPYP